MQPRAYLRRFRLQSAIMGAMSVRLPLGERTTAEEFQKSCLDWRYRAAVRSALTGRSAMDSITDESRDRLSGQLAFTAGAIAILVGAMWLVTVPAPLGVSIAVVASFGPWLAMPTILSRWMVRRMPVLAMNDVSDHTGKAAGAKVP